MEGEEDGLAVALLVVVAATDQPCSEVKEMGRVRACLRAVSGERHFT